MRKLDERIWAGVDVLLDDYARIQSGDKVVIAYTPESREPAAWIHVSLKSRGLHPVSLGMAPMRDESFAGRLRASLPSPDSLGGARLVLITVERDSMSHVDIFREALSRYGQGQWLAARIINASEEFFLQAMNTRSGQLSALNTALLERLMPARELRIRTAGGTDLRVGLDSERHRWVSNRGIPKLGSFMILPAGEVATYPARVDGVLVADGAFNVNAMTRLDARLGESPVRIRIEDSMAVEVDCANPKVRELVDWLFTHPHARRVGELGFGTNQGIGQFISLNSHINERRPGVHLGFGQHNQNLSVVRYNTRVHMDLIARGGQVWVDAAAVPVDLEHLTPSDNPHPSLTPRSLVDEDIDGDCCGLMLDDGSTRACAISSPHTSEPEV